MARAVSPVVDRTVGELFPGSFALVMATGIISVAASLLGFAWLAWALLWANGVFYILLWVLTAARAVLYPARLLSDFRSHAKGAGFLTMVAGTCVLGTQAALVAGSQVVALGLLCLGAALWLVQCYGFFTAVMVSPEKPDLGAGLHGGWLILVVGTQSLSVLSAVLAPAFPAYTALLLFPSLCLNLVGGVLYLIIITLLVYRLVFHGLSPQQLTPLTWIAMGAAAITTLAGARLTLSANAWVFLEGLSPFLRAWTLLFWSTATWWIPLLGCLGVWRHLVKRLPIRYEPQYWSLVFPLGMYTTCTLVTSRAVDLEFLLAIPRVFLWIALAAWLATAAGMVRAVLRALAGRSPAAAAK